MLITTMDGYEIHRPTSGGKSRARSSAMQVRESGFIVKQFRYKLDGIASENRAYEKAKAWIKAQVSAL